MKKETRWILISIALVLGAFAFAYYLFVSERDRQQMALETRKENPIDIEASVMEEQSVGQRKITLYFYNPSQPVSDQTLLRREEREVFDLKDPTLMARQVALEVLKGPKASPVPDEVEQTASPQLLRQCFILDDGTAVVDLEGESVLSIHGVSAELAFIHALTRSLRENVKEVERVEFLVDGKQRPTLAGHISLAQPFM